MSELDRDPQPFPKVKKYVSILALFWTVLLGCLVGWNVYQEYSEADKLVRMESDFRGGVSVPAEPYYKVARAEIFQHSIGFGIIWLIGMCGIIIGGRRFNWHMLNQSKAESALLVSEEKLRVNEERLDLAMMVNNDGMYDWDVVSGKTFFDARYYTMAGYEPDEFASTFEEWAKRIHPDDFERIQDAVKAFHVGEIPKYDVEFRFKCKDGSWMWIRARGEIVDRDENGEPLRLVGTHTDITARKEAEEKLKESERESRTWLEYSPVCTKKVDLDLNLQFMSRSGLEALNIADGADLYGKPYPLDFYPDDFKNTMTANLKKVIATGEVVTQEAPVVDVDGNELWFHSTIVPVNDDDGKIDYLIVVSMETTARKRAELEVLSREQQLRASNQQLKANEQQLNASNQQLIANEQQLKAFNQQLIANEQEREGLLKILEFKNKELQDIVYTASHDLKSPLVNISGFSGHLSTSCEDLQKLLESMDDASSLRKIKDTVEKEIPESLGFITSSVGKMKSLIDGLLRISRIGTAKIEIENIDMNELLEQVRGEIEFQLQENVSRFDVDYLPDCRGDKTLLNRVFTNLIDNAMKYREPSRETLIEVSGRVDGGEAVYCVRDNGRGVEDNYCGKIFEIFHRLNPDEGIVGEGLGLTIVTRIVDRLGGRIWLDSEFGVGSSFFVSLPKG